MTIISRYTLICLNSEELYHSMSNTRNTMSPTSKKLNSKYKRYDPTTTKSLTKKLCDSFAKTSPMPPICIIPNPTQHRLLGSHNLTVLFLLPFITKVVTLEQRVTSQNHETSFSFIFTSGSISSL